jgi:diguanylate cyclase (GGDEF)-like protein
MSQSTITTLHLLILHESTDLAEQMINSLRNAGHATRAHHISASDDFSDLLKNKAWDMFVARPETDFMNANDAILQIQKLEKDIPSIVLLDEEDLDTVNDYLQAGAEDAIPHNDPVRLQLVVARELKNLANRRKMRESERAVKETEKRSSQLLDHSKDAIAYVIDGMHVYANQAYVELFAFEDEEDVEITPVMDLIANVDKGSFKEFIKEDSEEEIREIKLKGSKQNGDEFETTLLIARAEYDGEACTQIKIPASSEDPELKEQLEAYKNQDMVTGLPNQNVFENVLDGAVEKAAKENGTYSLFNIRLDDFNKTKSQIGVAESDILIGSIAEKLQSYFPAPQFIARFGAETFTAINYEKDLEEAKKLGEKIRQEISEHMFDVDERTVQITISIGIAFINEITTDGDIILNKANDACQLAYEDGKNGNQVNAYEPAVSKKAPKNLNISQALQEAMDNGRLKVLYQPIINLQDATDESYEVFMRLVDEEDKEISMSEYLDGISNAEIGEKVDRWVILQAVKALAEHRAKGHNTKIFINITERSLLDKSLAPWLGVALKAARLPGNALVFQIAETEAVSYLKQAAHFAKELAAIKCGIAIKHFGGALNPFNIVQHMNIDYFKIDHSFIQDLNNPENKQAITELITGIHEREKQIIVPFIESASMLSNVWQLGADYIQGFYFQEPAEKMSYDFASDDDED